MKRILLYMALMIVSGARSGFAQTDQVIAILAGYDGTVDVIRRGFPLTVYPQLPLVTGDIVSTRDGKATVRFEDKTEIKLRSNSKVTVSDQGDRRDVDVFLGRLWAFIVSRKDHATNFKTGGTIAAIRGTTIEYAANADGSVDIGVIEGALKVRLTDDKGNTTEILLVAGFKVHVPKNGPIGPVEPFKAGDIADATTVELTPAATPSPVPSASPTPPPAPKEAEKPAESGDDSGEQTQAQYAMRLVNALGLGGALPANATANDAMDFLAKLGIFPADGHWDGNKVITLEDQFVIAGIDPNDPNAPLTIPLEEMIARILDQHGELFWIQSQRRVTVSAFAP